MAAKKKHSGEQIEWRAVDTLTPHPRNSRTHSDHQVQELADSIKQFGQTFPILITGEGMIIAGEGRWRALKVLGETQAKVLPVDGWPDEQIRAYLIADNKLALNAGWDPELLAAELRELEARDFKPASMGFTSDELARLLDDADEAKLKRLEEEGGGGGDVVPSTKTPDGMERVNLPMLPQHLEILREALRISKSAHKVPTTSEALAIICSDWMEAQADDKPTPRKRTRSTRSKPRVHGAGAEPTA